MQETKGRMMNGKKLMATLAMVALLAGCATTGEQRGPTLAEVRDTACPIVIGVVMGLQVETSIEQKTKDQLAKVLPGIEMACSYAGTGEDLRALAQVMFSPLLGLIAESNMTAEQKQAAIIGLTTAKLVILNYRPPQASQ